MKYCIICGSPVVSGHRQYKDHLQHYHPRGSSYDAPITSYFQDQPPVVIQCVGSKRSRSPAADSGDLVGDVEGSSNDGEMRSLSPDGSEQDGGDVGGCKEEYDAQEMSPGSDDNRDDDEEPFAEDTSGWPCPTGDQDLQGRVLCEMDDIQAGWTEDEECPFILEAGEWPVPANWQLCEDEECQQWWDVEGNIEEPTVDWAALSTQITRLPWEKMILFLTRFFTRFRMGKMQQVEILKLIGALIPASLLPMSRAAWKKAQVDTLNIPLPQKIPFCPKCQKICPTCLSVLCSLAEAKNKCNHPICEVCQTHRKSFSGMNVVPGIQAFIQAYDALTVTPGHFLVVGWPFCWNYIIPSIFLVKTSL